MWFFECAFMHMVSIALSLILAGLMASIYFRSEVFSTALAGSFQFQFQGLQSIPVNKPQNGKTIL